MNRKKKKQKYITIGIVVVVLGLLVISLYQYASIKDLKSAVDMYSTELENNQQVVYVATALINRGDIITDVGEDANVELQTIYTGLESFNYISADDLGGRSTVTVSAGIPIMYSMITDEEMEDDTRAYEIAAANLAIDQAENDFVDIRIMFPNGEDFIVISKAQIMSLNMDSSVFTTYLNEEEILRFSSAVVDAYTTTGARLYTTKYIESNIQKDAEPTYPVRETTLALINSDPNVLTKATETLNLSARLSLEERLGNLSSDELDAVSKGFGLTDTAKSSVLSSNAGNSAETVNVSEPAATEDMNTDVSNNTENNEQGDVE